MEVAAGVVAAEQVISTTIEAGVIGGYALAQPTQPLKATFTRIASSPDSEAADSLQRSAHTSTVLHGKAYIFGGITSTGDHASNDMHIIALPDFKAEKEYQCIPAIGAAEHASVPTELANHSACASGDLLLLFGGLEKSGKASADVWAFNTNILKWASVAGGSTGPEARYLHSAVCYKGDLIVHGGLSSNAEPLSDVWILRNKSWTELPEPPVSTHKSSMAVSGDTLYLLDHAASHVDTIYQLDLTSKEAIWQTITLPSGLQTTIPESRIGAAIIPLYTGHGRHYILQLFGVEHHATETLTSEPKYLSDMWTLQLPSEPSSTTKVKDVAREKLNFASGEYSWGKVEVQAREQEVASEGKSLPGPLAHYGVDNVSRTSVLLWGGVDATGKTVGDGWMIEFG